MTTTSLMTADEFARIRGDGRFDLIRGEVIQVPPAGERHGRIAANIELRIGYALLERGLGQTYIAEPGFVLARDPDVVLCPDAAFILYERFPSEHEETGFFEIVPDIVLEVISPSDRARDVIAKLNEYLKAGVPLVWLADPAQRTMTVYAPDEPPRVLGEADELDGGDIVPDFRLSLREVFSPPGS